MPELQLNSALFFPLLPASCSAPEQTCEELPLFLGKGPWTVDTPVARAQKCFDLAGGALPTEAGYEA